MRQKSAAFCFQDAFPSKLQHAEMWFQTHTVQLGDWQLCDSLVWKLRGQNHNYTESSYFLRLSLPLSFVHDKWLSKFRLNLLCPPKKTIIETHLDHPLTQQIVLVVNDLLEFLLLIQKHKHLQRHAVVTCLLWPNVAGPNQGTSRSYQAATSGWRCTEN